MIHAAPSRITQTSTGNRCQSAGGTANFANHFINYANNPFRLGPMTDPARLPIAMKGGLPDLAKGHMTGIVLEGREDLTRDNYAALDF